MISFDFLGSRIILESRERCSRIVGSQDDASRSVVTGLREISRCVILDSFFYDMFDIAGSPLDAIPESDDRRQRDLISLSIASAVAFLLRSEKYSFFDSNRVFLYIFLNATFSDCQKTSVPTLQSIWDKSECWCQHGCSLWSSAYPTSLE